MWEWSKSWYFDPYVTLETPILDYCFNSVKMHYELRNDIICSRQKLGFLK
jgi:hypothetical protein